jgi:XTP/dITP diphosphohydrolase
MRRILLATSNPGKLRDFAGAAKAFGIEVARLPGLESAPAVEETGKTFAENARLKAECYSRRAPGEWVIADDSGLEVDALGGAPGVLSARYAADETTRLIRGDVDLANNARLLHELARVAEAERGGRFVCVIAAARDGVTQAVFEGEARGNILRAPRGHNGFGYDPLFYFPELRRTFAELAPEEKARVSHRGAAFRRFLDWYVALPLTEPRTT